MKWAFNIILLSILILPKLSVAEILPPIVFGPEFTFSSVELSSAKNLSDENYEQYIKTNLFNKFIFNLRMHLIENQPEGEKFKYVTTGKFYSPEGWSFTVGTDDGVIEVIMKPMSYEKYKKFASNIQDAIFVTAFNSGLVPYEYLGGGHINIGLSSFAENSLLLRNFIVDFWNHSELSMGVLNYDTNNAIPFWLLGEEDISEIQQMIRFFDDGAYSGEGTSSFLRDISMTLRDADSDDFLKLWHAGSFRGKFHALNLKNSFNDGISELKLKNYRLEVRSVRPQKSFDAFLRQIQLFEARIKYLSQFTKPIPLAPELSINQDPTREKKHLVPPVNPQEALASFYRYVTESGMEWSDHTDYLWPQWKFYGEIEKFEATLKQKLCVGLLERQK